MLRPLRKSSVSHLLWNCLLLLVSFEGQPYFIICYDSSNEDLFLPGSLYWLVHVGVNFFITLCLYFFKSQVVSAVLLKQKVLKSTSLILFNHFLNSIYVLMNIWKLRLDQTIVYTASTSYHSTLTNYIISTSSRQLWQICALNLLYLQRRLGLNINMIIDNCMPIDNKIPP